jgi:hypothetical protein
MSFQLWLCAGLLYAASTAWAQPRFHIDQPSPGSFALMKNNEPFIVKGAGAWEHLADIVSAGGNSLRTWGLESRDGSTYDEAQALGLTVCAGLWMSHQNNGANYLDPTSVQQDYTRLMAWVNRYKAHPAIMLWGVGNEVEIGAPAGPYVWQAIEHLASSIKAVDPNHPTIAVLAGVSQDKITNLKTYCPSIDALGVNQYAGAINTIQSRLTSYGWTKPWLVTEFGPYQDFTPPASTSWGAARDPSSTQKGDGYLNYYQQGIAPYIGQSCLGSYLYQWGFQPFYAGTDNWYGVHMRPNGEKLAGVEAIQKAWTGSYPANRAPQISSLASPALEQKVAAGAQYSATVQFSDSDHDPVQVAWEVHTDPLVSGSAFSTVVADSIIAAEGNQVIFKAPTIVGNYRLYVLLRDGQGHGAEADFPFRVENGLIPPPTPTPFPTAKASVESMYPWP